MMALLVVYGISALIVGAYCVYSLVTDLAKAERAERLEALRLKWEAQIKANEN